MLHFHHTFQKSFCEQQCQIAISNHFKVIMSRDLHMREVLRIQYLKLSSRGNT